jgi:hypothetical protein
VLLTDKGIGGVGCNGCVMGGWGASCAVGLGFVCMYRGVVRGCVRRQGVGWGRVGMGVGGSLGCVVGGDRRGR